MRIRNLIQRPFPILLADGSRVILPAGGELENVEVHDTHLPLYQAVRFIEVFEDNSQSKDKSGENGVTNSIQEDTSGTPDDKPITEEPGQSSIDLLRTEYKAKFGQAPDGRWKEARLKQELEA